MGELYIGMISGTSADAIDAVLVDFSFHPPKLSASLSFALPGAIQAEVLALNSPGENEIQRMAKLDVELGRIFSRAVKKLNENAGLTSADVLAIGSHGQTIRHIPDGDTPTSYQVGDPNIIAEETGICTVADFRRRDMAAGGQGAPLVPAFHNTVFRSTTRNRVVLNIGGISNITILPADTSKPVSGFDTGPGNALLDAWYRKHHAGYFDASGDWARKGTVQTELLEALIQDPYFSRRPPKSTGKEYFHLAWLENQLAEFSCLSPQDIQATLIALTVNSINIAIEDHAAGTEEVIVCGGGKHNQYLMDRLAKILQERRISLCDSDLGGVNTDMIEAMAFIYGIHRGR